MIIDAQNFTKREGYLEASASTRTALAQYSEFAKNYKKKLGFQLVDGAKIL